MTIERPETVKELIELGTHVALAFRNSARARSAAVDFAKMQTEGPLSIGPMAYEGNTERRIAAIRVLGEFRTHAAVPYLERSIKKGPSADDSLKTKKDLFHNTLAALFRAESYGGHRIIRVVYESEHSKWVTELPSIFAEAFQGARSNLSWLLWSRFKCSYPNSITSSDGGVDAFNRQQYVPALMQFSDAVRLYPYYSGYWRQMGDTKVRMAKEGSKADYDGFRKWWKLSHPEQELKERLRWGGINDLTVARALAPFLASDLVDIGYGIAMAEEFTEARLCYDQALALYSGETTRAYIHFRRAEAKEGTGDTQGALLDYKKSKSLHECALDKQRTGREMSLGLPSNLESMVADITQRIQRLERK
ncbi:MAG: hypothetical protein NTW21_42530 [Verrucomicrobia bacterium]|nr:hypothetical protein [Verrucomicrobiota bacterium]